MFLCTLLVTVMCRLTTSLTTVTPITIDSDLAYPEIPLDESCIAGLPLPSCRIKCYRMFKKAYCESNAQCKCRFEGKDKSFYEALISSPPHFFNKPSVRNFGVLKNMDLQSEFMPTLQAPQGRRFSQISNTDSIVNDARDTPHSVVLFFIQLKKTFRLSLDDNADPPATATSSSQSFDNVKVTPKSLVLTETEVLEAENSRVPQFVCFLLVLLLCCLILAELAMWYRKETKRNNMDSIFERDRILEKA
ncbi:uncharacterized protein LOC124361542 [Homalodisca vitripennis]|uniref:uncharacterized protein LOC124361542 n=1 Tax=Homalodisca vitripennis TaxID=197043 RepID=UPI001EEA3691|nr:uncharacterized protein LOC124361542 [Homalodisca vitripennis]